MQIIAGMPDSVRAEGKIEMGITTKKGDSGYTRTLGGERVALFRYITASRKDGAAAVNDPLSAALWH